MCWKLVDDISGEIICRSTIRSAIEPGTANLQVDPVEPLPDPIDTIDNTENSGLLNDFISLANFETPLTPSSPIDIILDTTKSKLWQDVERGINRGIEHNEYIQQRLLHSSQPKINTCLYCYPTRSKSTRSANTVQTDDNGKLVQTDNNGEPTKFVYLKDDGERPTPVWKQYEFIL